MYGLKKFCHYLFSITTILLFLWAICTSIFVPRMSNIFGLFRPSVSYNTIKIVNMLCLLTAIIIVYIIFRIKNLKITISNKTTWIILSVEIFIYLFVLLSFFKYIDVTHFVDDSKAVYKNVFYLKSHGNINNSYMYLYPQNLFLLYLYNAIMSLFGTHVFSIIVFFALLWVVTIIITFVIFKTIGVSNIMAIILVQVLFLSLQVGIHVAIAYTDILILFFLSSSIFFLVLYMKTNKIYLLIISIFIGYIAFLSKGTALIYLIAIGVYLLVYETGKRKVLFLVPLIMVMLGSISWNSMISYQKLYNNSSYGMPNTHWIMMGTSNYKIPAKINLKEKSKIMVGGYSNKDFDYSKKLFDYGKNSKAWVSKQQIKVLKKRMSSLTPIEFLEFLNLKVSSIWSSGDLKSTTNLGAEIPNVMWHKFSAFVYGKKGMLVYSIMQTMQFVIYVSLVFSFMKKIKKQNKFIDFAGIYSLGYFMFLLIWEANPRYTLGIFPIAIVLLGIVMNGQSNDSDDRSDIE